VNNGTPETTYYVYDGAGQRVRKVTERQSGTRTHERTYLGGFEVYREYDGNGTSVTLERESLHVIDDKQRIALVETRTVGSDGSPAQLIRYQFGNHLGSASLELDDQANVISYEEYTPYGSTSYQAVRNQMETPKRYRYIGMERDEESEFARHGARYYLSWLGRWLSADPKGISDGSNLYSYANGMPTIQMDSSGLQGEPPTQLSFSEHSIYDFIAIATKTTRGFTEAMHANAAKLVAIWGGPKEYDLGHLDKPFSQIKAGEAAKIRIQERGYNRSVGASVERQAKSKVRIGRKDPAAPSRGKYPAPPKNPELEYLVKNFEPKSLTPSNPTEVIPPSPSTPPSHDWEQLELNFEAKTSQLAPQAPPTSSSFGNLALGTAITTTSVLAEVSVVGDYATQISQGDYTGARHTAEAAALILGVARVHPALAIPFVAVGARAEYVNNREGITRRANWVGDLFNPWGINPLGGGVAAGLYAATESTVRAIGSPVVKGARYVGAAASWTGGKLAGAYDSITDKIGYEFCVPFYSCH